MTKQKKTFIKKLAEYIELHFDEKTGIAWVEDGTTGSGHSCHPNIDASGSVIGMKKLGYWNKDDRTKRTHGFIYNIDSLVVTDKLDEIARQQCRCGGNHGPVERTLTELQKTVLEKLRKRDCNFLATATEEHWKRGEGYYIDDRVNVSKQLRAEFNRANEQVL